MKSMDIISTTDKEEHNMKILEQLDTNKDYGTNGVIKRKALERELAVSLDYMKSHADDTNANDSIPVYIESKDRKHLATDTYVDFYFFDKDLFEFDYEDDFESLIKSTNGKRGLGFIFTYFGKGESETIYSVNEDEDLPRLANEILEEISGTNGMLDAYEEM